ncbi:hypothetical protein BU17DRAFT_102333 [Hysterangium stoloniferum]|nr:hypothetical protein BU17DRAFT_102333 [Hysterangium stoloniferum]
MVAKTRGGSTVTIVPNKLQFKDKLVHKGYSTDALLKKLQSLQQETELIQVPILLYNDKGVKAYVACCLAYILRLCAPPDAPYTADELRDMFFFSQLSTGLKGTNSPYYNQYFLLLESLSTVKSVVLVCDLLQADDLMAKIFHDSFMVVRNGLAKKVELCMSDVLVAIIGQIHRDCPSLLYNIVPQLLEELKASGYEIHLRATHVLGEILATPRRSDKMAGVRIAFVEACRGIITHHRDLRQSIEGM